MMPRLEMITTKRTAHSHYDFDISIATASERIEDSDIALQLFLLKIPWFELTKRWWKVMEIEPYELGEGAPQCNY